MRRSLPADAGLGAGCRKGSSSGGGQPCAPGTLTCVKVVRSTFYFDLDTFQIVITIGTAISKPTAMKMITVKPPNPEPEGTPIES